MYDVKKLLEQYGSKVWKDDHKDDPVLQKLVKEGYYKDEKYFYFHTVKAEQLLDPSPTIKQERPYGPGSLYER